MILEKLQTILKSQTNSRLINLSPRYSMACPIPIFPRTPPERGKNPWHLEHDVNVTMAMFQRNSPSPGPQGAPSKSLLGWSSSVPSLSDPRLSSRLSSNPPSSHSRRSTFPCLVHNSDAAGVGKHEESCFDVESNHAISGRLIRLISYKKKCQLLGWKLAPSFCSRNPWIGNSHVSPLYSNHQWNILASPSYSYFHQQESNPLHSKRPNHLATHYSHY